VFSQNVKRKVYHLIPHRVLSNMESKPQTTCILKSATS